MNPFCGHSCAGLTMAGMNFQCQIHRVCTQTRLFAPSESQPPPTATGVGEGERLMVGKKPGMWLLPRMFLADVSTLSPSWGCRVTPLPQR